VCGGGSGTATAHEVGMWPSSHWSAYTQGNAQPQTPCVRIPFVQSLPVHVGPTYRVDATAALHHQHHDACCVACGSAATAVANRCHAAMHLGMAGKGNQGLSAGCVEPLPVPCTLPAVSAAGWHVCMRAELLSMRHWPALSSHPGIWLDVSRAAGYLVLAIFSVCDTY
jgi:hypothetical protein